MRTNQAKWSSIFRRARKNGWWTQALEAALRCSPGEAAIIDVAVQAYPAARGTNQGKTVRRLLLKHRIHVDVSNRGSSFTFTGPTMSRSVNRFVLKSLQQTLDEHFQRQRSVRRTYCSCNTRTLGLTSNQRRLLRKKKAEIRRDILDPVAQAQAIERVISALCGPRPTCDAHPSTAVCAS